MQGARRARACKNQVSQEERAWEGTLSRGGAPRVVWRPTARGVAEGIVTTMLVAAFGFRREVLSFLDIHPFWGAGIALALGSVLSATTLMLGFGFRYRRPKPSYRTINIFLAKDSTRHHERVAVIESHRLSWDDFLHGVRALDAQITRETWRPNLVVTVNQGDAIVGFLRNNECLRDAKFGSVILGPDRKPRSVSLPRKAEIEPPIRALLVDYQLKKGSAIAAAWDALDHELGVQSAEGRVAVLVLGDLSSIPRARKDMHFDLHSDAFRPVYADFSSEAAMQRLERLYYLAFLCTSYPRPPWVHKGAQG